MSEEFEPSKEPQLPENKKKEPKSRNTLIVYCLCMFILPFIVTFAFSLLYGIAMSMNGTTDPDLMTQNVMAFINNSMALINLTVYLVIFIYVVIKYGRTYKAAFEKLERKEYFVKVLKYGIYTFAINIVVNNLLLLIGKTSTANQEAIDQMLSSQFLVTAIAVVLCAPVVEEVIFRLILQDWGIKKFGPVIGILFASFLFAAVHMQTGLIELIPYITLGLCFGLVYYKTKNIAIAMGVHMFNNAVAVFLPLLLGPYL